MKRFINWSTEVESKEPSDIKEIQSSDESFLWRKQSPTRSCTAQYFSKNQNAIDHSHDDNKDIALSNQNENQQLLFNTSSPSTNFTTDDAVELRINTDNKLNKTDSHLSQKSVTITRRISKPSRHESIPIATSETRQRQRDRFKNYQNRLHENQLYSLIVSLNGVECYGTNCQPSVYNASQQCRLISTEKDMNTLLMNDQDIKQNTSYISLTNLIDIIDHEPNVSRRDSYSQSTSNSLMHKPSLFLIDIFNKMTHAQRAKSIAQLVKFHENLSKSNTAIDQLQRTASLPNANNKPTKLHSATSLLSERTTTNIAQMQNKTLSTSLTEKHHIDENMISDAINLTTSNIERTTDLNTEHTPVHISDPVKSSSLPESKLSKEDIPTIDTNKPSATISSMSSSIEDSLMIKPSPNKTEPILNSTPAKNQASNNELKAEINLANNTDLSLKQRSTQNIQKSYSKNDSNELLKTSSTSSNKLIDHPSQSEVLSLLSPRFQSSNNVIDHLSQQNIIVSNTNLDKSINIPYKELPLLETIDELLQYSKSSHSSTKNSVLLNISPTISITEDTVSKTLIKPELMPLSPTDDDHDDDRPLITRTATVSTNLTTNNDDDDNDEQVKRSSLGLARDSLELLRNATPHHHSNDEQLISYRNNDSTPNKRKSVLKSRLDSSDILPTPDLISYIAIDEVKGDKDLMEKQMRRRSLTVGGGTIISCTSPKPKRDSLILLQERYSGPTTPRSGCYELTTSDSKHVEFIREPGDTITPALHIGRGIKSKHPLGRTASPPSSNDHFHRTSDSFKQSKSEISVMDSQLQLGIETRSRRPSLDSTSRYRTPQTQLTTTTNSFININDSEEEKICFNKSDYKEMVRLMLIPSSKTNTKDLIKSTVKSNTGSYMNNRLSIFLNLILLILSIFFYIFIFIKSQYW